MGQIVDREELKRKIEHLKKEGKKIVFTNGCFDILHVGHVRYLKEAKKLGDILVVAINSDSSVKKIKPLRPINSQNERAEVLASLKVVDFVTFFDEETPYELINFLRPDVLVKGGDWKIEQIVGAQLVDEVYSLPYVEGVSTTEIINKIIERYCHRKLIDKQLIEKAKKIKLLVLDVDGVLTPGGIIYDNENNEFKIFNVQDGHGIVMLIKSGIKVAVITARQSKALDRRIKELGIEDVFQSTREKFNKFKELMAKYQLISEEVAAMGDDIVDLSILKNAGLSVAPFDAHEEVKKIVDYITEKKAGQGAVRELCDIILISKGLMKKFVDEYSTI